MEYDWESAYRILVAMQNYPDPKVPSPDVELDEDTGLPPPPVPHPPVSPEDLSVRLQNINLPTLTRAREQPQISPSTNPKSWIGEMDRNSFLVHTLWLKEERFIATRQVRSEGEHPDRITVRGIQLLKEIEAKGGWEDAVALAQSANSASTLTSLLGVLQKAKPRSR